MKLLKNKKFIIIFISIILIFLILLLIFELTIARYQKEVKSNAPLEYALYILNTDPVSDQIKIGDITPRNESYIYSFSVSNFKDEERLETNLDYTITITSTTNLPIDYRLVINDDYTTNTSNSFVSDELITDEDGTYFRVMKTSPTRFTYTEKETNYYYLVVDFPINYIDSKYQDISEFINIKIESNQVTD